MAAEPGRRPAPPSPGASVAASPASMSATVRQPAFAIALTNPSRRNAEHGLDAGLSVHREPPRGRSGHEHRGAPRAPAPTRTSTPSRTPPSIKHRDAAVRPPRPRRAARPARRAPDPAGDPPWFDTTIAVGAVLDRRLGVVGAEHAFHEHRHAGHLVADPRAGRPRRCSGRTPGACPAGPTGSSNPLRVSRCRSPSDRDVHRPDDRAVPGRVRAAEQRGGRLAVAPDVELPPQDAARRRDVLEPVEHRRGDAHRVPDRGRGGAPSPVRRRGAPADWNAHGAIATGNASGIPRTSVRGSGDPDAAEHRAATPAMRANAASLSASVRSAPAPPAM